MKNCKIQILKVKEPVVKEHIRKVALDSNRSQMGIALVITLYVSFIDTVDSVVIYFIIETSVGEGTFGKVKLGKHELTGEKVN